MGKRTKKLKSGMIGMLLALAMVMTNFAGLGPESEKANAATMQGNGTSSDPYKISNYAQLKEFADIVNGTNGQVRNLNAWAILTADIICTDELWVPIADYDTNSTNTYYGTFDCKGYKIIGLSNKEIPNVENLGYQGLFGYVGNNGVVTNVKLEEGSITGRQRVGGVAGCNYGSISNCYNTGAVSGNDSVGGVAGENNRGSISICYNTGAVSGAGNYVGGVAGLNDGSISNCYNTGAVSGAKNYVGGVAGWTMDNPISEEVGSISYCYNTGAVSGANNYVGGVAGLNDGSISYCYNTGAVSGANNDVGGVAGENNRGSISNCYNTGAVSGAIFIGGVAGNNFGSISNCYNTGAVSGQNCVGGVAGKNAGNISNCYNTGAVTGASNSVGGVAGNNDGGSISYCYYDSNRSGQSYAISSTNNSVNVKGLTTEQMTGTNAKTDMIFAGTESPWLYRANDDNNNYFYPHLNGVNFAAITPATANDGSSVDVKYWPARVLRYKDAADTTSGTSGKPYKISDYNMLKQFASIVNSGHTNVWAELTNDIVCTDELWVPIGNDDMTHIYGGTFDGKNYRIIGLSNIKIPNVNSLSYQGLFGFVDNNGVVKNVKLEGGSIAGNDSVGGVAGENYNGSISNCYNTGAVSGAENVGGVVGANVGDPFDEEVGRISNCYNTGAVSGNDSVGGVAGFNFSGSISNCYNAGSVSGPNYVGGVAGYNNSGSISNCYNTGAVSGAGDVGGVAGENYNGSISNCYNTGAVSGAGDVGGVAGENYNGSISNCYNTGAVSGAGNNVGGVAGYNFNGSITDCGEKTLNELSGSGVLTSMGFGASVWTTKADAEYDGKNYWFYPHLKVFCKEENGNPIHPENIPADKWPAKVEISICGLDSKTYDKAQITTSVIANKPIIPDGKIAKYSVLNGTSYTGEYAVMPTDAGSYRVSIYDDEAATTPSEIKYFDILSAGENKNYTVYYQYMTGTNNGAPVWENTNVSEIKNIGTYKGVINFGNGRSSSIVKQFTITARPITVTPDNVSKEFGSPDPELTYTVEGLLDGDSLTGSLSRTTGEGAAEYDITLGTLSKPNDNYDIILVTGKKLSITPKALGNAIISLSAEEFEYDGTARTPNVTVYDGETVVPASEYSVNITGNVNAGTATVKVSDVADGNYSVSGAKTFTIKEAPVTVTGITAKDKVYDGNDTAELDLSSVTIAGVLDADRAKVSVAAATGKFENANAGKNKRVIVSNIQLTGTAAANYCLSATGNQTEATAEIFRLDSRINEIPLAKSGLVYTGNRQELITEGTTENGTLVYALTEKGADAPDDNMYSTDIPAATDAGTYTVYYKVMGDANYNDVPVVKVDVDITPKALGNDAIRLSAEEFEYNGTAQAPGVAVYDGENQISDSEYSVNITGNVNAGTATVEVSDLADGNYSVSGAKTFTIKEAPVTVTGITAKDKVYDGNDTAELDLSNVAIAGVLDADRAKVSVTAAGKFENANAGKNKRVIVSNIQLTGTAAANYCLSDTGNQTEATAEIFKLDSRINEIPLAKSGLVYTGNKQELITEGATENGTLVYALTEKGAVVPDDNMYSTDIPAATDAGTYTVYYKVTGDANYNDVPVVKVDVEIKKASQDIPDVSAVDETVSGKKDGQITGLSDKMEISTDLTSAEFKAVEDILGTGYAPGTYYVRYSADANHNASDVKAVTIKAGEKEPTPEPQPQPIIIPSYDDYTPEPVEPTITPGVETTTVKNSDGSVTTTTKTTHKDGSVTLKTVTERKDGGSDTEEVIRDKDGKVVSTMKETVRYNKYDTKTVVTTVNKANGYSSKTVEKTYTSGTVSKETTEITPNKTVKYIKEVKKKSGKVTVESVETNAKGKTSLSSSVKSADKSQIVKVYSVKKNGAVRLEYVETGKKVIKVPDTVTFNGVTYAVDTVTTGAFAGNNTVTSIKLGSNIRYIQEGAFLGAENLQKITVNATSLKKVYEGAFDDVRSDVVIYIEAPTKKSFNKAKKKLLNAGLPTTAKVVWTKIIPEM